MKKDLFNELEKNIISWYDFKKDSKILYLGKKEDEIYNFLKENHKNIDILAKEKIYDYIVMIEDEIDTDKLLENIEFLKEDGIILLAFNNEYGISKFVSYDYKNRKSPLEKSKYNLPSIKVIKEIFKNKRFSYLNLYMPFPNIKRTDLILTPKIQDIGDKIDKYFVEYNEDDAIITDEIRLLRKISKYNNELFINLSNSYLLEVSKKTLKTDVKYVSFNNYRKKEYRLTTIIKENVVEKRANTKEAKSDIEQIAKNINILKDKYNNSFEILDKYSNNTLYSEFIENEKTLDIVLGENYNNEEFVINILNDIKEKLLKNSVKHTSENQKNYISVLKETDKKVLEKLNFLEYAFYDMVPKNCFYINNKYYFFDQEWMEKFMPVEFIIYRSIINSYDLVRNINVDNLLQRMNLLEYKELFEKIDYYLRKKIIDIDALANLNKNYSRMYEVLYEKEVLKIKNSEYEQNNIKQDEYIKLLESKLQKK